MITALIAIGSIAVVVIIFTVYAAMVVSSRSERIEENEILHRKQTRKC